MHGRMFSSLVVPVSTPLQEVDGQYQFELKAFFRGIPVRSAWANQKFLKEQTVTSLLNRVGSTVTQPSNPILEESLNGGKTYITKSGPPDAPTGSAIKILFPLPSESAFEAFRLIYALPSEGSVHWEFKLDGLSEPVQVFGRWPNRPTSQKVMLVCTDLPHGMSGGDLASHLNQFTYHQKKEFKLFGTFSQMEFEVLKVGQLSISSGNILMGQYSVKRDSDSLRPGDFRRAHLNFTDPTSGRHLNCTISIEPAPLPRGPRDPSGASIGSEGEGHGASGAGAAAPPPPPPRAPAPPPPPPSSSSAPPPSNEGSQGPVEAPEGDGTHHKSHMRTRSSDSTLSLGEEGEAPVPKKQEPLPSESMRVKTPTHSDGESDDDSGKLSEAAMGPSEPPNEVEVKRGTSPEFKPAKLFSRKQRTYAKAIKPGAGHA